MAFTYENITTLIPNTTMQKMYIDGVQKGYRIKPIANYVLHDNTMDTDVYDETFTEIIGKKFGYSPSSVYVSCGANYDFSTHTVTDENGSTYIVYGDREFFAIPESDVPADQIFGTDEPEHEVM